MSDAKLARRATQGDERAFAAIFDRYHQEIYRFCLSILGNAEDARDALQNTMLKALQALPDEKREIRLRPWLYRVAHNEAIDLVRKRRETAAVDPELAAPGDGLADTVAQRERLRQLLLDLGDLPERQRAALVMRELGGLAFEQIAEAFDTSPATARQTVYEARVNLRSLEEGREMSCEEVMHRLSNADGRVNRRRDLKAHLRACSDCRAFRDAIDARHRDFAALAPLPAIASAGVLHAILGGAQGAAGGAGTSGATVAAGAGKAVSAGLVAKSAATVAVVAAIGVSGADRAGLIHTGLPGGSSDATPAAHTQQGVTGSSAAQAAGHPAAAPGGKSAARAAVAGAGKASAGQPQGKGNTQKGASAGKASDGQGEGSKEGQPPASQHGQETASEHRHGASAHHGQGQVHHGHGQGHHGDESTSHQPPAASHHGHHGGRASSHHGHHGGHAKGKGGSTHSHPQPKPKPDTPASPKTHEQPPSETTSKAKRSSGSGAKGAESHRESEGMP
jgi:RNA polymerase sigma factor (sigma-70 family)